LNEGRHDSGHVHVHDDSRCAEFDRHTFRIRRRARNARREAARRITALFLATTVATSVTGFFFLFHGVTPGIVIGIISLVVLAIAVLALYRLHLAGPWRWIYVVTALMAQYLNVFVLVVQLYEKVPALHRLDPTQSGPPFKITQLAVLVLFVVLTSAAAKFHPRPARAA